MVYPTGSRPTRGRSSPATGGGPEITLRAFAMGRGLSFFSTASPSLGRACFQSFHLALGLACPMGSLKLYLRCIHLFLELIKSSSHIFPLISSFSLLTRSLGMYKAAWRVVGKGKEEHTGRAR